MLPSWNPSLRFAVPLGFPSVLGFASKHDPRFLGPSLRPCRSSGVWHRLQGLGRTGRRPALRPPLFRASRLKNRRKQGTSRSVQQREVFQSDFVTVGESVASTLQTLCRWVLGHHFFFCHPETKLLRLQNTRNKGRSFKEALN